MKRFAVPLAVLLGLIGAAACLACGYFWGIRTERRSERDAAMAWRGYPTATHGDDFLKDIVAPTVRIGVRFVSGTDDSPRPMMGTGVIVSADGLILTAWHIADPSQELTVQLCSYRANTVGDIRCATEEHPATVLKRDDKLDIALLRLKTPLAPVAILGDSDAVAPGELLWRVGLDRIGLACGPVSRLPDGPDGFLDVLFPTPGGASGGPVYNGNKELVGIITGSPMDGLRGFSIPVNRIRSLFSEFGALAPKTKTTP